MTPEVRETDPDGIDYGWIMQVTFIVTIVIGSPAVAVLSLFATLPTWSDRALFAVRVGAAVWFVTMLSVYAYARRYRYDLAEDTTSSGSDDTGDHEPTAVDAADDSATSADGEQTDDHR